MLRSKVFEDITMFTAGDVAGILGRPNIGKTSIAISEAIYLTRQNSDVKLLYLTTEVPATMIMKRMLESIVISFDEDLIYKSFLDSGLNNNITVDWTNDWRQYLNDMDTHYDVIIIDGINGCLSDYRIYGELKSLAKEKLTFIGFTQQLSRMGVVDEKIVEKYSLAHAHIDYLAAIIKREPKSVTIDIRSIPDDEHDIIEWDLDMDTHYISRPVN